MLIPVAAVVKIICPNMFPHSGQRPEKISPEEAEIGGSGTDRRISCTRFF